MEVSAGKYEDVPQDQVCKKCGLICATWPQHTIAEIIDMSRKDRAMKAEIIAMGELLDGKSQKCFNPACVQTRNSVGLRIELKVAVVAMPVFTSYYGMPAGSVQSQAAGYQVHTYINEDGEKEEGVIMKLKGIPADLDHHIAFMYSITECDLVETTMAQGTHLREGQGKDTWAWSSDHVLQGRGPCLRASNKCKVLSHAEWQQKVQDVQEKRAELQQKQLNKVTPDEEDEAPRVRATFTGARPSLLTAPSSGSARASGGAGSSAGAGTKRAAVGADRVGRQAKKVVRSNTVVAARLVVEDGAENADDGQGGAKRHRCQKGPRDIDIAEILEGKWQPGRTLEPVGTIVELLNV